MYNLESRLVPPSVLERVINCSPPSVEVRVSCCPLYFRKPCSGARDESEHELISRAVILDVPLPEPSCSPHSSSFESSFSSFFFFGSGQSLE